MRYLDHNAAAPLDPRVRASMQALLTHGEVGANPSSVHRHGQLARSRLEDARRRVAHAVGAGPLEVVFTSGGTEADALALLGSARALRRAGRPCGLLTSPIEHPAVLQAAARLEAEGHACVWVEVDDAGRIRPDHVAALVREHPGLGLVSLAAANHELGNAYDLAAIVAAVRAVRADVLVHTDAVQALGKRAVDFAGWGVDLLSLSAHKIGGPAGVGALVHRKTLPVDPLWGGGHQERGRRPGTENLLGAHALGLAAELAAAEQAERAARCRALRERVLDGLRGLEGCRVLGDPDAHTGNTVLAAFAGCTGELLMINLDLAGIAVSTGAACSAGTLEPSPVVLALGLGHATARSTLRISLGHENTEEDVDALLAALAPALARSRAAEERAP